MRGNYIYESYYVIGNGETFIVWDDISDPCACQYTNDVLCATKFKYQEILTVHTMFSKIGDGEEYVPMLIKIKVEYEEV
jgi:hypothetical protein